MSIKLENLIHERVNGARQSHDKATLALDPDLRPVARYHSGRIADVGRIFHEGPDGETLADRLGKLGNDLVHNATGQSFCHECGDDLRRFAAPAYCAHCGAKTLSDEASKGTSGENLALVSYHASKRNLPSGAAIAARVVDGWIESLGHRENLLNERFEREAIGVAIVERSGTQAYITQVFS